jgi:DNA-binding Lrp family transcriptional regulator
MNIDKKDINILKELQRDCRQSLKKMSRKFNMSITTLYDRIKKMEKNGVIKGYTAILDPEKVGVPVTAFIFVRAMYHYPEEKEPLDQREIAKKIGAIPGVSEVHIVAGEWDILVKVKGRDIKEIGDFVIDKLRNIKGVERTLTSDVWVTTKESPEIFLGG